MRMLHTFILLLSCCTCLAQTNIDKQRQLQFNLKKGWAIEGYDPVAYFEGRPSKGDKTISLRYQGVNYAFASVAHLDKFKGNPSQYEPQYGGWCAYAMGSSAEKVEVDPETYKIVAGKLYLFYHSWSNNTLTKWNKAEEQLKSSADKNWTKFYKN